MRLCRLCKRLFSGDQAICPDDKSSTVEAALEQLPGELQERFPEREPLAQGGTGTLYLIDRQGSIEEQLGPQVVLKVLAADLTEDPAERIRIRRDLRKQMGLEHPQLPAVLEEGEADGRVWFTREYIPATSLAVRLHLSGAFGPDAAINLIVQLSAALDGLHQLGLVHRDLKPGHVLLLPGQPLRVQLLDATLASPLVADNNARRGTADYAAKEIIEGAPSTARSDLYALGCLSYELIAGVPPFRRGANGTLDTRATLAAQRNIEPKALPDIVPAVVRSAIASMLSKDARRRPFSARQVKRSIESALSPAKPAARSGALSALQREAAALRLTGATAKHRVPTSYPDATVELDVRDLDEAIQAEDPATPPTAAGPKQPGSVDDSAPTIALQPKAAARRPAPPASVGDTHPYPPVTAQDLERLDHPSARMPARARGDITQRTHVSSDITSEPGSTVDAAFHSPPKPRPRTSTKFGLPAVATDAPPPTSSSPNARSSTETGRGRAGDVASPLSAESTASEGARAHAGSFATEAVPARAGAVASTASAGSGATEAVRASAGSVASTASAGSIATEAVRARAGSVASTASAGSGATEAVRASAGSVASSAESAEAEGARARVGEVASTSSAESAEAEGVRARVGEVASPPSAAFEAARPHAGGVASPSVGSAAQGATGSVSDATGALPVSSSGFGARAEVGREAPAAAHGGERAEAPRRSRTATKFGIPMVRLSSSHEEGPASASDSGDSAPAELPRRSRTGTKFGIPAVVAQAVEPAADHMDATHDDVPPRRGTGTKFGIPAVVAQAVEPAADRVEVALAAHDDAPHRRGTGTKFGLGPVNAADVEAAALAAELQREHAASTEPLVRQHGLQPTASSRPRTRYSSAPKPLMQSPRLLLWAAAGLAALIVLLRVVLGPAERARSTSIIVHVPAATSDSPTSTEVAEDLSEQALIGGDIERIAPAPLAAASGRAPRGAQIGGDRERVATNPPAAKEERAPRRAQIGGDRERVATDPPAATEERAARRALIGGDRERVTDPLAATEDRAPRRALIGGDRERVATNPPAATEERAPRRAQIGGDRERVADPPAATKERAARRALIGGDLDGVAAEPPAATAERAPRQALIGGDLDGVAAESFAATAERAPRRALIGGDLDGVGAEPFAATAERAARRAAAETPVASETLSPESAGPELESDDEQLTSTSRARVPTVSALSVRGGLARAAANRQGANGGNATAPDYKALGRQLYNEGKYREAAEAYQRATKQNPSDAAAYAGLGGSLLASGDVRKAITAYQKAVRLEPAVSGFQAALGRAYLTKGDRTRARAAYAKALELDPNNQAARTGMASAKAR